MAYVGTWGNFFCCSWMSLNSRVEIGTLDSSNWDFWEDIYLHFSANIVILYSRTFLEACRETLSIFKNSISPSNCCFFDDNFHNIVSFNWLGCFHGLDFLFPFSKNMNKFNNYLRILLKRDKFFFQYSLFFPLRSLLSWINIGSLIVWGLPLEVIILKGSLDVVIINNNFGALVHLDHFQ